MCPCIKRLLPVAAGLLLLLGAAGCSRARDNYKPEGDGEAISIQYLKTLYKNYPLPITRDLALAGTVVSNDRYGNFSYSLVIEDETGGIEIKISKRDLFRDFPMGQRVVIRCAGLVLGTYGGSFQLGLASDDSRYEVGLIPSSLLAEHIVKSEKEPVEPTPTRLAPEQISERYVDCWVLLENVQFAASELGLMWGEATGYARRTLQWCSGESMTVETSPDALFIDTPLPAGRGSIAGVLRKFNKSYSLVMLNESYQSMRLSRCGE